jgi:hypothetical protein
MTDANSLRRRFPVGQYNTIATWARKHNLFIKSSNRQDRCLVYSQRSSLHCVDWSPINSNTIDLQVALRLVLISCLFTYRRQKSNLWGLHLGQGDLGLCSAKCFLWGQWVGYPFCNEAQFGLPMQGSTVALASRRVAKVELSYKLYRLESKPASLLGERLLLLSVPTRTIPDMCELWAPKVSWEEKIR